MNSRPELYSAYIEFLSTFEKTGSKKEFDSLDGPNLIEIVKILKNTHSLDLSNNELLKIYLSIIYVHYDKTKPTEDIQKFLCSLKNQKYKIDDNSKNILNCLNDFL